MTRYMAASEVQDQMERLETLPAELLLGYLCWTTISTDIHIPHDEFVRRLIESGLTVAAPGYPLPSDVYKRAVKEHEKRRVINADDTTSNWLIRHVRSETDGSQEHNIVQERVDPNGHRLSYSVAASIRFLRGTETILVEPAQDLSSDESNIVQAIGEQIEDFYVTWRNALGDYPIRGLVRHLFHSWNAAAVRPSGGIYFLRTEQRENLDRLEALVNELPGRSSMHSLPLVDDRKQREMLRQAFEDETIGEVDKLIGEVQTVLVDPDRKITAEAFAKLYERFSQIQGKTSEYSDLLDSALEMTSARLEVLEATIMELPSRMK